MAKTIHRAIRAFLALVLLFISLCSICGGVVFGAPANAASNVLEDLQKDESFDISTYPEVLDDYSLYVIQIAESTDGELLIYVYQPSGQGAGIFAKSINIAREKNNSTNLNFASYTLEYLNSFSVFYKYRVEDFKLINDDTRYYNISNITRPFNALYDKPAESDNKITEVENRVGQLWAASTDAEGNVHYEMTASEVIEITKKFVGYIAIYGGAKQGAWYLYRTDTHKNFVAFSTNYQIDRLMQAEIEYSLQEVTYKWCANQLCPYHDYNSTYDANFTPKEKKTKILYADRTSSNSHYSWLGCSYTWYDIQSTEDFLKDNNNENYVLTSKGAESIEGTQWVLNFHNSELFGKIDPHIWDGHGEISGEDVSDVMILRLMFETDGVTFNLGVVDNKQTGSTKPVNKQIKYPNASFFDWLASLLNIPKWLAKLLVIVIPAVIIIIVLCLIFPAFGPALGQILLWVLKAAAWIISLPFKAIAGIAIERRERRRKQKVKQNLRNEKLKIREERKQQKATKKKVKVNR